MKKMIILALTLLSSSIAMAQPYTEAPKELYIQAIENETLRISPQLESVVGIQVLRTDNPHYRLFISQGLMQVTDEAYLRLENGLASIANMNPGQHPQCFVLLNPERNGARNSIFKEMLVATQDPNQSAAFLVGHEVGHCLSFLERDIGTHKKSQWNVDDAVSVGIQRDAFLRTFGQKLPTKTYFARSNELYADLAQRQYDERVADAFAALWYIRLGGMPEGLAAVEAIRKRDNHRNAHYTGPVFDQLAQYTEAAKSTNSVLELWNLAKKIQQTVGVDESIGPNSRDYKSPIVQDIQKKKNENKPQAQPAAPARSLKWNEIPRL